MEKKSNLLAFAFHKFSNYFCHLCFKEIDEKKNDKVKFNIIPKTNE